MLRVCVFPAITLISLLSLACGSKSGPGRLDNAAGTNVGNVAESKSSELLKSCDERLLERTDLDLIEIEAEILNHLNAERRSHGLKELTTTNPCLQLAAVAHSENMARQGILAHTLDNQSPFQRLTSLGVSYQRAAENIYMSMAAWRENPPRENSVLAEEAHLAWKNSSGHWANMMNPHYEEVGIGVAWRRANGNTYLYATQVFVQ